MSRKHAKPAPPLVRGLFQIPQRPTVHVELNGELTGAWLDMLVDPPSRVADVLQADARAFFQAKEAGTPEAYTTSPEYRPAVAQLIKAWNLAHPDTGDPLPPTLEGLDTLDWAVINTIMTAWGQARALPKSNGTASSPPSAE